MPFEPEHRSNPSRRQFLKWTAGLALGASWGGDLFAKGTSAPYLVGVGRDSDPYAATIRAINSTTEWNPDAIANKRVVIKTNLVRPEQSPESGTITDPEVVRAIVDLALEAGAEEIWIVESGQGKPQFTLAGYDFFESYDPSGRIRLVELDFEPVVAAPVTRGLAYRTIYMPAVFYDEKTYLISVAKLKVHDHAGVTLAMKNMFGTPAREMYLSPPLNGRFAMHDRSVAQTAVDINAARPIDFAVVDGIWAMEERGPFGGNPVRMDTVIAGRNALATDLVCLYAMGLALSRVLHLRLAMTLGHGPRQLNEIQVRGDSLQLGQMVPAVSLAQIGVPIPSPALFRPASGRRTTFRATVYTPCLSRIEIVRPSPSEPELPHVRLLKDWSHQPVGRITIEWDGRDNEGAVVPPGAYALRIAALSYERPTILYSFGYVRTFT